MHSSVTHRLNTILLSLSVSALAACGGGGGGESSSAGPKAITAALLNQCPAAAMSPIDMAKMSCIVGQINGLSSQDPLTAKPCSVVIDDKGNVTVTQGDIVRKHSLSNGIGSFNFVPPTQTAFSEYTGRIVSSGTGAGSSQTYESFHFDYSTGTVDASGSPVSSGGIKNLQIQYLAPINGSLGAPTFFVGSTTFGLDGVPALVTCRVDL